MLAIAVVNCKISAVSNVTVDVCGMSQWYLLYCKPKQEQRALENLKLQGIDSFYPTFSHSKLVRGTKTTTQKPLFPNYLFVFLDETSGCFTKVKNTRGVASFVMFGNQYQRVPEALVASTRTISQTQVDINELPKTGDVVELNTPVYKGLNAIYKEPDGDKRSILLLQLLNQEVEVIVENSEFTLTQNH